MKKFSSSCSKSNGSAVGRFAEILLIVVALVAAFALFAACNGGSGSAPSTDGGAGSAGQTTVGQIYLESGVSLDRQALLENETQEIAVSAFGEGSTVVSFGIEQGTLSVISLNGGALSSVVVSLPEEVVDILNGELSSVLLKEANLTQNQTVSASEKEQVKQKLFEASQSVQSQIGEVSSLTYGTQNSYITGSVRQNGSGSVSVLGAVRSDGSVLLFDVLSDGKLSQSVFKIENAQSMTEDELWQAVTDGSLQPASQSDIDISAVYAPPAVEEKITIGEIYDQNFSNVDFSSQLNDMFVDIVKIGYPDATSVDPMFYDENGNKTTVYYEMIRGGRTYFGGLTFPTPDGLPSGENLEAVILQQLGLNSSTEVPVDETAKYVSLIGNAINSYDLGSVADGLTITDLQNKIYNFSTSDQLPAPSNDFGEALLNDLGEQGDIIATYVGDMSRRILDSTNRFNTGYYTDYDIVVVYEKDGNVNIVKVTIYNAWYTNSTNESLYANIINGTSAYQLGTPQTTTITAPVYVAGEATL